MYPNSCKVKPVNETLKADALRLLKSHNSTVQQFEKLDLELRNSIDEMDSFWIRWSFNLERLGIYEKCIENFRSSNVP